VRHVEHYDGVFFLIADKTQRISAIHINAEELSVDDTVVALWSRDPIYVEYLLSNFEQAWAQGVDSQERIDELLRVGPSQA
jgi:hypothetical protein